MGFGALSTSLAASLRGFRGALVLPVGWTCERADAVRRSLALLTSRLQNCVRERIFAGDIRNTDSIFEFETLLAVVRS